MSAPAAAAQPPNPAVVAALRGEFSKVYNGRRLRTQAQSALVTFFAGRGETLVDVISHVSIDKSTDEAVWKAFWARAFGALPNCDDLDLEQFYLWAHARCAGAPDAAQLGSSQAKKTFDILDANGYNVNPGVRADIEAAMAEADAGNEKEQCCCALAVWYIYFGRSPLQEETDWWNLQYHAGGGMSGRGAG